VLSWKEILVYGLGSIFGAMSPSLKEMLAISALNVYRKAKETTNPFDDIGAALLCAVLGVETEVRK